jgi:hypothetical protein
MNWKTLAATVGTMAMLIGSANALTVTNEDEVDYTFDVILGEGGADTETIELPVGQNVSDICEQGCTIKLPNGSEQSFEGDENVTIKDGVFMIAE